MTAGITRWAKFDTALSDIFSASVDSLRGVGPKRSRLIANLGAATVEDLLKLFPRRYEDRRKITKISGLVPGRTCVVFASVESTERRMLQKAGLSLVACLLADETGVITALWFNRKGLEYILKEGTTVALYGVPSMRSGNIELSNPEFEVLKDESDAEHFTGIIPVYPSTDGLPARWFRHFMEDLLKEVLPLVPETLPEWIINKRSLMSLHDALSGMHKPDSAEEWKESRRRLAYEELLLLQTGLALKRKKLKETCNVARILPNGGIYKKFRSSIPFELTNAQKKALDDIFEDTAKSNPMSRILQGDVGSGKTLVAIGLAAASADAGVQTVIMAPTEVLADQLYLQADNWLSPLGVKCVILKGGQSAAVRRKVLDSMKEGSALIVVGTQALLESGVGFKNLGTVIIDEQHRFGVMQRGSILTRDPAPHLLMMSATPIPRTLTLCLFGDLDISILREKPVGRCKIETRLIDIKKTRTLMQFIADEVRAGGRVYWICPRVEDDGALEIASVENRYSFIKKHLGILGAGLLHGRMESSAKEEILNKFRNGDIKILVSTTVLEVGVDVPEASVIVIESPERFGLSQLHQLRGRVGRGSRRGLCVLLVTTLNRELPERLSIMLRTDDGFEIAEADLAFRGAGELSGLSQHGITEFQIADLNNDIKLLLEAKDDASEWVARDNELYDSPIFREQLKLKLGEALGIG